MNKKWLVFALVLVLFILLVGADHQTYHLKLLAVQETDQGHVGSDADLYLELRAGTGRVFLDTFPLTKIDTQISTRFAKEIACKHFKLDCSKYDFIYTIKAKSSIIGGPSAGTAIAALTTIAVLDLDYNPEIAMTGTINSGGIVGPVGGVKEKLEAAATAGLKKVLISPSNRELKNEDNSTLNLITFAQNNLSLEVKEVIDLDEIIFSLTGIQLIEQETNISENKEYQKIMQGLQELLCDRTKKIESELKQAGIRFNSTVINESETRKEKSESALKEGDYYSAASYCFGNNIFLKNEFYQHEQPSPLVIKGLFEQLENKVVSLEIKIEQEKIETISDLQTLMVVKERIDDVKKQIDLFDIKKKPEENYYTLAYAEERFFSALSWMQFFSMEGKKFVMDKSLLKESCINKISEAEQREQYVSLFLPDFGTLDIKEKLESSKESLQQEEYELCLIKAAQAKAESNAIFSSLGLREENVLEFVESKNKAVERVIFENSAEGVFPILGYSYYQYANSLKEEEKYTALVYLEYALEMSDLSIYFPEEKSFLEDVPHFSFNQKWFWMLEGFLIGVILMIIAFLVVRIPFRRRGKSKHTGK